MRSRLVLTSGVIIALAMQACSPSLYTPTERDVPLGSSLSQLLQGRAAYREHCGSCHRLKLPTSLSRAEWPRALVKMRPRAKLDSAQAAAILQYLLSAPRDTN